MEVVGDVARGEDPRDAGLQAPVDEDAVLDREAGRRRELRTRCGPHAHDDRRAVDRPAAPGADALDHAIALERRHAVAEQHLHAVLEMDVAVDRSDLRAEDALQRHQGRADQGDLEAALARARGHLGPDPAPAHDDELAAGVQALAERIAVGQRPQIVDAVKVAARNGQAARLGAGREQQTVEREPFAGVERKLAVVGIDVDDALAEAQLDRVVGVEARPVDEHHVPVGLPAQILLGQRRTLVRTLGLGADEHYPAVEALLAQRLRRLGAGQTGADDGEHLSINGHPESLS